MCPKGTPLLQVLVHGPSFDLGRTDWLKQLWLKKKGSGVVRRYPNPQKVLEGPTKRPPFCFCAFCRAPKAPAQNRASCLYLTLFVFYLGPPFARRLDANVLHFAPFLFRRCFCAAYLPLLPVCSVIMDVQEQVCECLR